MMSVDFANAGIHHSAAAERKKQAAGGDEVSVEAFEKRKQGCGEDDIDDPSRTHSLLKRHCGHELRARQQSPRGNECYRRHNARIEKKADKDRHPDGAKEVLGAEFGAASSAALPTDSNPVMK